MRAMILCLGVALVAFFYITLMLAPQRSYASTCHSVWDSTHTHVLYITCPVDDDDDFRGD